MYISVVLWRWHYLKLVDLLYKQLPAAFFVPVPRPALRSLPAFVLRRTTIITTAKPSALSFWRPFQQPVNLIKHGRIAPRKRDCLRPPLPPRQAV